MEQILWLEIIVKGVTGGVLIFMPLTALALLGVARPDTGFWPRLAGAVTVGVAVGIWVGLQFPAAKGAIGPGGLIPINLFAAGALIAPLIMGRAAPTRRGKLVLVAATVLLLGLAFLEIAHV